MSEGPHGPEPADPPADKPADPADIETVIAPVERRIVAAGSKSEREATVAIIDDRRLVLRHRGAGAYDDPADLADLAGRTARLTGTRLATVFLVDEAVAL